MAGLDSRVCMYGRVSLHGLSWGGPNMAQWTVWRTIYSMTEHIPSARSVATVAPPDKNFSLSNIIKF